MKKWLTAAAALTLLLAGCQQQESSQAVEQPESTEYTVTDDRGEDVTLPDVPETIVSLQPSNTEILFDLGVGDKVVGVTEFDTYPAEAADIERISDSMTINAERIIELDPDVVIAYTIGEDLQIAPLEEAGIPVFVIETAATFEDVYGDIEQIATVVGEEDRGDELVEEIKAQIDAVTEKVASLETKKLTYFEISPAPDIWSAGEGSFQQEILKAAGIDNVFADQQGWFNVSAESIIEKNPEVILTTVNYVEDPIGEIKSRPAFDSITAVKEDAIFQVDSDIMSRPATRIGEAVELAAKTVYPELFK
ncbi:cobalamin-binding protein [Tetzosporium hominis]|uniref:Cobalamin-binding protein n=1 Tax=Tetzosporium hominis TaxID=2020506 RepID=A0A264W4G6_9BACL|nr:ABC transporter substrate-binding protein [Tetzosporium hominis]OZS78470.1 cobalamin-binding protein [Tetzosporium hominis]